MYAIFHSGRKVVGWKEIDYEGEEDTFQLDYILLPEAPNKPDGHYVEVHDGELVYIPIPPEPPAPPAPEDRIQQLETELASANLAIIELWETVLG